jgi:endonuclease YncB( thermonuclease family)
MRLSIFLTMVLAFLLLVSIQAVMSTGIEMSYKVTQVIDGDTFDISTGQSIRLAGINAPESYESGYEAAKNRLNNPVYDKTVYLDIDDVYRTDYNGTGTRLVSVAYVDYNSTHLLNVNKALLDGGYAVLYDFQNEFSPSTWALYMPRAIADSIVINEVELNPPGTDEGNEWVELFNPTSNPIDISNWTLSNRHGDTESRIMPQGTIIGAGGYLIYTFPVQWLDNVNESVSLKDSGKNEVDQTPVLDDNSNDDRTWQRYPNGVDTNSLNDWTFRNPTKEVSNGPISSTLISTSITCIANPIQIIEGNTTTISGSISPTLSNRIVTLTCTKPGGVTLNRTAITNLMGGYSDLYQPDTRGSWSVQASWAGDSSYYGSTSTTATFTVTEVNPSQPGSGCVVATATYGSEVAPQVQALRDFRETIALKTFAGSSFMVVFNSWYYSWSPPVAAQIAPSDPLRAAMTIVLQPILYILQAATATFSALSFNAEFAIVMAGLVAAVLIGLVYLTPFITLAFLGAKSYRKNISLPSAVKAFKFTAISWIISVALIVVGEITLSPVLMMVATGAFVILTIILTVSTMSLWLAGFYRRG